MSIEKAKEQLRKYGYEERVQEFEVSSATVELAAQAVGCEPGRIAKTLSFMVDEAAILIVVAGDARIDNRKYKDRFHTKAKMLSPQEAVELIGHAVGGVCPFGVNEGVRVYLDISLRGYDVVYPACGSSNSAVRLSIAELERCSEFTEWVDVCKTPESTEANKLQKLLICYGDSLTYGYDPTVLPEMRFPENVRWTGLLRTQWKIRLEDYGLNGRCIPHTPAQIEAFCELVQNWRKKDPQSVLMIMLGTNDQLQNPDKGADFVAKRMEALLAALLPGISSKEQTAQLILAVPPLLKRGTDIDSDELCRESERLGDLYEKLAKENRIACFRTDQIEIPLIYDGVHLSAEGNRVFAENIAAFLKREEIL